MHCFNFMLVFSFILSLCLNQTLLAQNDTDWSPIKRIIDEVHISKLEKNIPRLMQKAHIPGMSLALIHDGKIFWSDSFGTKRADTTDAVNDSTVFQAASLSKTVFAYIVLQLVEQGQLDLDTRLANYWETDYVENDDRDDKITARMVLSHTTGFPNWRPRDGSLEIYFSPGERFSYSGEGFVYLQRVVETLTGEKLNKLAQKFVFEPLGMRHSSYTWRPDFEDHYAVGHGAFGNVVERDPMTEANAAYSLYTTAEDYAKFVIAILNTTELSRDAVTEMLSPQIHLDPNCTNCTQTTPTELSENLAWGLGWGLQLTDAGTSFWHWGDQGIFRCYTVAFQESKIGLVYFTNSQNGLSVGEAVLQQTIGGSHPALSWLQYDPYDSPIQTFARKLYDEGVDAGMAFYDAESQEQNDDAPLFSENAINQLGYRLLRADKLDEAIAVFKLNVDLYPDSWNVYDSLGEAYMERGDTERAIQYYKKSIAINSDNDNGKRMLEKLMNE